MEGGSVGADRRCELCHST